MRILKPLALSLFLAVPAQAPLLAQDTPEEAQQAARDRSYLTGLIEDNLSGAGRTVRIDGFKGALSSKATFDVMSISDADGAWITITNGAISWNRSALLKGAIEVDELSADEISVPRLPKASEDASAPSPEAQPFSLPDLPVSVRLGKLDVKKLTLGAPVIGEELAATLGGSLRIADGEGEAKLDLKRTDKDAEISLTASFANGTRQLGLDLLMREAKGGIIARKLGIPGQPALTLALAGTGPLDNFGATLRLSSDGSDRLAGKIQLLTSPDSDATRFVTDLSGDLAPLLPAQYRAFFGSTTALKAEGSSGGSGCDGCVGGQAAVCACRHGARSGETAPHQSRGDGGHPQRWLGGVGDLRQFQRRGRHRRGDTPHRAQPGELPGVPAGSGARVRRDRDPPDLAF